MCLGFSQITRIRPFLRMILHFSQIGLTDDLTFILVAPFLYLTQVSVYLAYLDLQIIRPFVKS